MENYSRKHKRRSKVGDKIAHKAFNGLCTLRNGIGAAGRLAIAGQLGQERKLRELRSARWGIGASK